MELIGTFDAEFQGKDKTMEVNIFHIKSFTGEPTESEEMRPQWFNIAEIPLKDMWPDDTFWMPFFLQGQKFKGNFIYDGYSTIINHSLKKI
jgi:8-oxo-dGTP diphosphatase / 2-hydroxy-dATP diphosphatase